VLSRFIQTCVVLIALFFVGVAIADTAGTAVFVAGKVQRGSVVIAQGDHVNEGDELTTGNDGYIYIKTVDEGFLILRPSSKARIVSYHIDQAHPESTSIKLELLSGVARSISGKAAKQSRDHFRFNTPVAAIGIRGTDFTVFTDQSVSRVSVTEGGVVVSGFNDACSPSGSGPCNGGGAKELYWHDQGLMLQVVKGATPNILPLNQSAPNKAQPPRGDEPDLRSNTNKSSDLLAPATSTAVVYNNNSLVKSLETLAVNSAANPPPPEIIWGRWQSVLNKPATLDVVNQININGASVAAINAYYAVLTDKTRSWVQPGNITLGFALQPSEAFVQNLQTNAQTPASIQSGALTVNFANSSFNTNLAVASGSSVTQFQSAGVVSSNGLLSGNLIYTGTNNMTVQGALSNQNGGSAVYLFQGQMDNAHRVTGITNWLAK
jgi:FecR protein